MRVAWGVKNLFGTLPYNKASDIRNQIIAYFGRTHYYRIYREERFISPEDQQVINRIFANNGITEMPVFDSYSEVYKW